ncbi:MAG: ParB/RepB/Spo0J family partition protein [Clostridia bacterium]|nr:ParB/RepB/Spo0J family partition protein [Clostridia bacterium]
MNKINQFEWEFSARNTSLLDQKSADKPFASARVTMIPLSAIDSGTLQARKRFDEVAILALADSIRRHGLLQPILVRRSGKGLYEKLHYICVAGERRLRAYKMLGRKEIPCLVLSSALENVDELSLAENLMRKDLDMFEYASALETLTKTHSLTQGELAAHLSTSQFNVANKIALLNLLPEEQMFILLNGLTERHARALLRIKDLELRQKVAKLVAERQYTAKRTEEYIDVILSEPLRFLETQEEDDDMRSFINSLNCSLTLLRKKDFAVQCEAFDHEDEVQFLIRIPKK